MVRNLACVALVVLLGLSGCSSTVVVDSGADSIRYSLTLGATLSTF